MKKVLSKPSTNSFPSPLSKEGIGLFSNVNLRVIWLFFQPRSNAGYNSHIFLSMAMISIYKEVSAGYN